MWSAAAATLAVGPHTASAVDQLGGAFTQIAVARAGLGSILVDGRGRTLYLFEKDKGGKSACKRGGALARQVTYNRHSLHAFVEDAGKGQTTVEGIAAFGAGWYVVSASGAKIERSAGAARSGGYGTGGHDAGGYSY